MAFGKRSDMLVHTQEPYNAEPPPHVLGANGLTPLDAFYVRTHGPVPRIDQSRWRLRVGGRVDRELELSLGELQAGFAEREITATLQCAGNRRVALMSFRDIPGEAPWRGGATGTATWRGVSLRDVLQAARLRQEAQHIELLGSDVSEDADPPQPFGASIARHKALAQEVLLAWEMNGQPLPDVHGGPVRVVVPGYIGARSVKWIERLTARTDPSENYFQSRSYRLLPAEAEPDKVPSGTGVALGAVAVGSDILSPSDGATISGGEIEVVGYAFAGDDRRIVRVDVSCDAGSRWIQAELLDRASPWAWRRWRARLTVGRGRHQIVARAWDSAAATQPEEPGHLWNPKGYVNNAWARVTVTAT
ncbi:MAG: sulfite oxidase [Solirubrobacterales bacterium]|nr:sulfite oxidase [Solirubrobacterales bacterium]